MSMNEWVPGLLFILFLIGCVCAKIIQGDTTPVGVLCMQHYLKDAKPYAGKVFQISGDRLLGMARTAFLSTGFTVQDVALVQPSPTEIGTWPTAEAILVVMFERRNGNPSIIATALITHSDLSQAMAMLAMLATSAKEPMP